MTQSPAFQTEFASRAFIVANVFNKKFEQQRFTGKVPRVVLVMPSTEATTEGGKLARSNITLKSEAGKGQPPLQAGYFDVGNDTAVLNTYEAVFEVHAQRGGKKGDFALDQVEYDQFLQQARQFLEGEKFQVTMKQGKPVASGGAGFGLMAVLLMLAAAAVGGAAVYFLKG